jgi:hypothetical protein
VRPNGGAGDELVFRTLAAPGLEEDDLYAARAGGAPLWGSGHPPAYPVDRPDAESDESRADRHARVLARWPPLDTSGWAGPA